MNEKNAIPGSSGETDSLTLRVPTAEDGMPVNRLVAACPPLDHNSAYCNLLQCHHFANTAVAAEIDGELVGFVSGYRLPEQPHVYFVWQIAVGERARGMGLAGRMIRSVLARDNMRDVTHIHTTIGHDNAASQAVFKKLARELNTEINSEVLFDKHTHFDGEHDDEVLFVVGPFNLDADA